MGPAGSPACCWQDGCTADLNNTLRHPQPAYHPPAAGGTEGRSGIAALLKIINAAPGKPSKHQAGGGRGAKQQEAGDDSESDDDEAEAEGGGERTAARGAGRRGGAAAAPVGKGQPRQQLRPLMRPIICICNDLYAPALRPLRDVAKVFHFKKPQVRPMCLLRMLGLSCCACCVVHRT